MAFSFHLLLRHNRINEHSNMQRYLTLLLLLTGLIASPVMAKQPLTPRIQSHLQALEQMSFCAGLNVAYKKQADKMPLVKAKKTQLITDIDDEIVVFTDAIDGIASRLSATLIIDTPNVFNEALQTATARIQQYEKDASEKFAEGGNIDEHLQNCSKIASQLVTDMGHRQSELGLNSAERKEAAWELAARQKDARCFAIASKALEENPNRKDFSLKLAEYHFFMAVEGYTYVLEDLRPSVATETLEEISRRSIEPHANELAAHWDAIEKPARQEWINACLKK